VGRDSNPVTLSARELPAPPPGFQGAVGELEIVAEVEPAALSVGDAATYTITLSGAGHLQGLPAPQLPEIQGLRAFPPQQESDESAVGSTVRGRRTWTFVLVPEAAGRYQLPALEIPYFDPVRGEYATAGAPAVSLAVRRPPPAGQAAAPGVDEEPETGAGGSDEPAPETTPATRDWRLAPGTWGLVLLGLALVGALVAIRLRRPGSGSPGSSLRAALRRASHSSKPREVAALIEEGWRDFLEARWGVPPGTASSQWKRCLDELGCPAEATAELVRLADDLHYLRYAPQLSDVGGLQAELILRSKKLARTLE
jgi:hypothetical protein